MTNDEPMEQRTVIIRTVKPLPSNPKSLLEENAELDEKFRGELQEHFPDRRQDEFENELDDGLLCPGFDLMAVRAPTRFTKRMKTTMHHEEELP